MLKVGHSLADALLSASQWLIWAASGAVAFLEPDLAYAPLVLAIAPGPSFAHVVELVPYAALL